MKIISCRSIRNDLEAQVPLIEIQSFVLCAFSQDKFFFKSILSRKHRRSGGEVLPVLKVN